MQLQQPQAFVATFNRGWFTFALPLLCSIFYANVRGSNGRAGAVQ
jgi:hypothetical protein